MLASKRGDAAIITDQSGGLAGIITDTDVTRRVVAKQLPASSTRVSDVMTANPSCVSMSDPVTDALVTMVENRFRHLPVTDDNGAIVGVLDIAKCLNDAITKLERSQEKNASSTNDAIQQVATLQGAGGQAAALQAHSVDSGQALSSSGPNLSLRGPKKTQSAHGTSKDDCLSDQPWLKTAV